MNHVLLFCKLLLYFFFLAKINIFTNKTKNQCNDKYHLFIYFLKNTLFFNLYFQIDYIENMAVIDFVLGLLKVVTIVYDIGKIFFNFHDIFVFKNKMNYNFYYLFFIE